MPKGPRQGSLLNNKKGFTLIELLVTLGIMSILVSVALPYAGMTLKRTKEIELQSSLRAIRQAIDGFYQDYKSGKISKLCGCAGESGYPKTLAVLVEGADTGGAAGKRIKYLRHMPKDPFADQRVAAAEQWGLRSYEDRYDSDSWGGEDVYDVYTLSDKKALDGSKYAEW